VTAPLGTLLRNEARHGSIKQGKGCGLHRVNSFRTAPSLCADMIFGKDNVLEAWETTN